jgi:hypothetical protein
MALLDYTVSKGPELSNPMDPNSEPTGNTIFVVDEYYESPAGIAGHWQDTTENWPEMSSAAPAWFAKATIVTLHNGTGCAGTLVECRRGSVAGGYDSAPRARPTTARCQACQPRGVAGLRAHVAGSQTRRTGGARQWSFPWSLSERISHHLRTPQPVTRRR